MKLPTVTPRGKDGAAAMRQVPLRRIAKNELEILSMKWLRYLAKSY